MNRGLKTEGDVGDDVEDADSDEQNGDDGNLYGEEEGGGEDG
jgi:hypothetical protein